MREYTSFEYWLVDIKFLILKVFSIFRGRKMVDTVLFFGDIVPVCPFCGEPQNYSENRCWACWQRLDWPEGSGRDA